MSVHNIISVSGGKDSTALLALAVVLEAENMKAVFADTGHEHPITYEYVDYLSDWLVRQGHSPIRRVSADFTADLARRREYLLRVAAGEIADQFGKVRHTAASAAQAAELMWPTGSAFLDLAILKGRFPSTRAAFCSEKLKRDVIFNEVFLPLMDADESCMILSWQGVRLAESRRRAYLKECDEVGGGLFNYRPILRWSAEDVFGAHRAVGLHPNPLYTMGMKRVGCFPCINTGKDELLEIADRFPEVIDRIEGWEALVSKASKRGCSTLFPTCDNRGVGVKKVVEWARTGKGGANLDLFRQKTQYPKGCSSVYGLCEAGVTE